MIFSKTFRLTIKLKVILTLICAFTYYKQQQMRIIFY